MPDDDFDLELDLDAEPERPVKAKAPPPAAAPAGASPESAGTPAGPAMLPAERPGLIKRLLSPLARLGRLLRLPPWNLRTFGVGVAVLLLVLVIVENWAPMRLSLIGLHADVPKAAVLFVVFILGWVVARLSARRRGEEAAADSEQ